MCACLSYDLLVHALPCHSACKGEAERRTGSSEALGHPFGVLQSIPTTLALIDRIPQRQQLGQGRDTRSRQKSLEATLKSDEKQAIEVMVKGFELAYIGR